MSRAQLHSEEHLDTAGRSDTRAATIIGAGLMGALIVLFLLSTVFRPGGGGGHTTTMQTVPEDTSSVDTLALQSFRGISESKPVYWLQGRAGSQGDAGWGPDVEAPFELLWQLDSRGGREFFSSPALVEGVLYLGCNDGYMRAVNASDGTVRWSYATSCGICGEPAVDSSMVFIGCQDGYVYALDRNSGRKEWSSGLGYHVFCDVAVMCDSLVLAGNSMGKVCALDRNSGRPVWDAELGGIVLGPAVVDTLAVFTTESGATAVLDHRGEILWSRETVAQPSAPSADSSAVFVGYSGGMVRKYDLRTGDLIWETDVVSSSGRCLLARPVVTGSMVLAGTNAGTLVCLGRERGEVLWEQRFDNWLQLPPVVGEGMIYLSCDDQRIHILDLQTGAKLDSLEMDGYSGTAPVLFEGVLYYGNTSGEFRALEGSLPLPEEAADSTVTSAAEPDPLLTGDQPPQAEEDSTSASVGEDSSRAEVQDEGTILPLEPEEAEQADTQDGQDPTGTE